MLSPNYLWFSLFPWECQEAVRKNNWFTWWVGQDLWEGRIKYHIRISVLQTLIFRYFPQFHHANKWHVWIGLCITFPCGDCDQEYEVQICVLFLEDVANWRRQLYRCRGWGKVQKPWLLFLRGYMQRAWHLMWVFPTVSCVFPNQGPSPTLKNQGPSPTLDITLGFSNNRLWAHSRNRSENRCPGWKALCSLKGVQDFQGNLRRLLHS